MWSSFAFFLLTNDGHFFSLNFYAVLPIDNICILFHFDLALRDTFIFQTHYNFSFAFGTDSPSVGITIAVLVSYGYREATFHDMWWFYSKGLLASLFLSDELKANHCLIWKVIAFMKILWSKCDLHCTDFINSRVVCGGFSSDTVCRSLLLTEFGRLDRREPLRNSRFKLTKPSFVFPDKSFFIQKEYFLPFPWRECFELIQRSVSDLLTLKD